MADHPELLKSMLQDIINDRSDQAKVTMHDYFVSKTREVAGMGQQVSYDDPADDVDYDNNVDNVDDDLDDE